MRKYRPDLEIDSVGVDPAGKIASNAERLLKLENCSEFVKKEPEPITMESLEEADRVIVMEEEHKKYLLENYNLSPEKIENWGVEDPIDPDVSPKESFEEIKNKVKNL